MTPDQRAGLFAFQQRSVASAQPIDRRRGTDVHPSLATSPAGRAVDIGFALRVVLQHYLTEAGNAFDQVPDGQHGYVILRALAADDHGNLTELARRIVMHPAVLTRRIDRLESAGLVRREPRPGDRRIRRPVITDEGRAMATSLDRALDAAQNAVLAPLSTTGRADFLALLQGLSEAAAHHQQPV
jgi:DNA-binding MarR family transcriptional regulator